MAKANAIGDPKQMGLAEASKESALLALVIGKAAMPWQAVTRAGDEQVGEKEATHNGNPR